jgi:hypothetical protein
MMRAALTQRYTAARNQAQARERQQIRESQEAEKLKEKNKAEMDKLQKKVDANEIDKEKAKQLVDKMKREGEQKEKKHQEAMETEKQRREKQIDEYLKLQQKARADGENFAKEFVQYRNSSEAERADLQKKLSVTLDSWKEANRKLTEMVAENEALQRFNESENARFSREMYFREQEIRNLSRIKSDQDRKINDLNGEIRKKEQEIARLKGEVEETEKEMKGVVEIPGVSLGEFEDKANKLKKAETELKEMQSDLAELDEDDKRRMEEIRAEQEDILADIIDNVNRAPVYIPSNDVPEMSDVTVNIDKVVHEIKKADSKANVNEIVKKTDDFAKKANQIRNQKVLKIEDDAKKNIIEIKEEVPKRFVNGPKIEIKEEVPKRFVNGPKIEIEEEDEEAIIEGMQQTLQNRRRREELRERQKTLTEEVEMEETVEKQKNQRRREELREEQRELRGPRVRPPNPEEIDLEAAERRRAREELREEQRELRGSRVRPPNPEEIDLEAAGPGPEPEAELEPNRNPSPPSRGTRESRVPQATDADIRTIVRNYSPEEFTEKLNSTYDTQVNDVIKALVKTTGKKIGQRGKDLIETEMKVPNQTPVDIIIHRRMRELEKNPDQRIYTGYPEFTEHALPTLTKTEGEDLLLRTGLVRSQIQFVFKKYQDLAKAYPSRAKQIEIIKSLEEAMHNRFLKRQ